MTKALLVLALATSLLAACGREAAKLPTSLAPATQQPTTAALAAIATSHPAGTTPEVTATTPPTPDLKATTIAIAGGGKPKSKAVATATHAATAEPKSTGVTAAAHAPARQTGLGINDPLAIPAPFLKKLRLQPFPTGSSNLDPQRRAVLKRYHARHALTNAWYGSPKNKDFALVFDSRFLADSNGGATGLVRALAKDVKHEGLTQGIKVEQFSRQVELGDEGYAFESVASAVSDNPAYIFLFRTDNVVSLILVGGEKSLSRKQAIAVGEAADRQVSQAVRRK